MVCVCAVTDLWPAVPREDSVVYMYVCVLTPRLQKGLEVACLCHF